MLVTTKTLVDNIAALKLVNGEEIIAKVVDQTLTTYSLVRPLSMVMMAGEMESQGMVAFAPWMLGLPDDATVVIETSKVLFAGVARKDAAEQYQTATGTREAPAPRGAVNNKARR